MGWRGEGSLCVFTLYVCFMLCYLWVVGEDGAELVAQGDEADELDAPLLVEHDDAEVVARLELRGPHAHRQVGHQGLPEHEERLPGRGHEDRHGRAGRQRAVHLMRQGEEGQRGARELGV